MWTDWTGKTRWAHEKFICVVCLRECGENLGDVGSAQPEHLEK